jgi:hypothetical protein
MPALGVTVQALVASYQDGRRVLVAPAQAIGVINSSTQTDENGEYHLDLPPGVYYMTGQYRESNISEPSAARALGAPFRVYYPGTSDVALAATIKLNGGEVPGIDFMLPVTPADLHKIYINFEGHALALNSNMAGVQIGELRDRITLERIPIVGPFLRGNFDRVNLSSMGCPTDRLIFLWMESWPAVCAAEASSPSTSVVKTSMMSESPRNAARHYRSHFLCGWRQTTITLRCYRAIGLRPRKCRRQWRFPGTEGSAWISRSPCRWSSSGSVCRGHPVRRNEPARNSPQYNWA